MPPDERRQTPRATVPLDGVWEGASGSRSGRIADISVGGCFVESMATPSTGERVSIEVTFPDGEKLDVVGEVVYAATAMGFGVRFVEMSEEQRKTLEAHVNRLLGGT